MQDEKRKKKRKCEIYLLSSYGSSRLRRWAVLENSVFRERFVRIAVSVSGDGRKPVQCMREGEAKRGGGREQNGHLNR